MRRSSRSPSIFGKPLKDSRLHLEFAFALSLYASIFPADQLTIANADRSAIARQVDFSKLVGLGDIG
jgi:hypothetical protein